LLSNTVGSFLRFLDKHYFNYFKYERNLLFQNLRKRTNAMQTQKNYT
jgi:hypothetical protein